MSNLDDKIRQVKSDIHFARGSTIKINIGKLFLILIISFLGLIVVSFVISSIKFKTMIDNDGLKIGKIFRLICLILCIIGIALSIKCLLTYKHKFLSFLAFLSFGVFGVICITTIFNIKSVYYDIDQRVVYYEKKGGYEIGKVDNNVNVTIYGEMNGKIVNSLTAKFDSNVQTITFQGGRWELNKKLFSNASTLKKIIINDAEVNIAEKTFEKNSNLNEIFINDGTLNVNYTKEYYKYDSDMFVFDNSKVDIYLNNGTLFNLLDSINLLDISGISNVNVDIDISTNSYIFINKVVLHDDVDLVKCSFKIRYDDWNLFKYYEKYYAIGEQIYIPTTIDSIPEYFFGNDLRGDTKIKVFFEGTEEDWNKISIDNNGNENYYSGNISVVYNSK